MATDTLTARLRAAYAYMQAHGWTQGTEQDDQGRVCLTGAVRLCAPQDGDEYLVRAALRRRGRDEDWNDMPGRERGEVLDVLATEEITDADLEATFGPGWVGVVRVVREAASLTPEQARRIAAAWAAAGDAAWAAAGDAASDAAGDADRSAARSAASDADRAAASDAARSAVLAEAARDLITPSQYTTLTAPWRTVFPTP